jgi:hypothetical protein
MVQTKEAEWVDFNYKKMGLFSGIMAIVFALGSVALIVYLVRKSLNDFSFFYSIFFFLVIMTIVFSILFFASRFYVKSSRLNFNDVSFDIQTHDLENILEDFIETLNMPYQKSQKELSKGTFYVIEFEMQDEGIKIVAQNIKGTDSASLNISLNFEREISGSFEEKLKMELKETLNFYLKRN